MATETIVAVYQTASQADSAIRDLEAAGVPRSSIQHYAKEDTTTGVTPATDRTETQSTGGFWSWILGEDQTTYSSRSDLYDRNIQSGGTVVTVISDMSNSSKVIEILESHHPIDLDEGEKQTLATSASHTADTLPPSGVAPGPAVTGDVAATNAGYTSTTTPHTAAGVTTPGTTSETEQVLPVREERLNIGKTPVAGGTTRLHRYVVEQPVEEVVRLRNERVVVERRPVSDRTAVNTADAFTEKTIEAVETREEAVVAKRTEVVEEVALKKQVEEHSETVRDTVRKEKIDTDNAGHTSSNLHSDVPRTDTTTTGTTTGTEHPNLAHPVETTKDVLTGEPTPAEKQNAGLKPTSKP